MRSLTLPALCKLHFQLNDSSIQKFFPIDSVINQTFRYDHIFQMNVIKRLASFFPILLHNQIHAHVVRNISFEL